MTDSLSTLAAEVAELVAVTMEIVVIASVNSRSLEACRQQLFSGLHDVRFGKLEASNIRLFNKYSLEFILTLQTNYLYIGVRRSCGPQSARLLLRKEAVKVSSAMVLEAKVASAKAEGKRLSLRRN